MPLFIKAPGQDTGMVDRGNALTVDVLPTIVDLLDIETEWRFDGESLDGSTHRPDKPAWWSGGWCRTVEWSGVLDVVRRNRQYLPHGEDWLGVAAVGGLGDRVGQPVTALDVVGDFDAGWSVAQFTDLADWDAGSDRLEPILLEGQIAPSEIGLATEALVALNGTVAGVAVGFTPTAGGAVEFRALLAEELLREGVNEVDLLVPNDAAGTSFRSLGPPGDPADVTA